MRIKLIDDLPIAKKHGCFKGVEFEAVEQADKYRRRPMRLLVLMALNALLLVMNMS